MNDDQKWLQAAAGIEQDIRYLKAAVGSRKRNGIPSVLEQEIQDLRVVLAVYKKNATMGVAWPHPDNLYCISTHPNGPRQASIAMRQDFKTAV